MLRFLYISLVLFAGFAILVEMENTSIYALWYEVDNDSFTASYCINIEKPELDCAGSCRMSSEMNSLNDISNNPMQMTKLALQETVQYFSPISKKVLIYSEIIKRVPFLFNVQLYSYEYAHSVFRPPISLLPNHLL